ncbi:MAG: isoleucine--tRNA ligase [Acidobacteriota bacterium]|jgi:isoleucyl-tRNA synthetase|nr:isoleucine--tRNA ligase [Acidobacteriota bacterium]
MELKNTLNLPNTSFSMKANLPQREPEMLRRWEEMDVYGKIRAARVGAPTYVLHDGPPYANGMIHMGTAINKIIKDIIVKSRSMMGFNAPYLPGWDCHGLPIEIKVEEKLGEKKAGMTKAAIRRECRKYAEKFIEIQRQGFKRLEVFGEWNDPYLTMSYGYEADITRAFGGCVEKGLVYKGQKPVHWCASCQTALAEAEVEYEPHTSPSVYVAFPVASDLSVIDSKLAGKDWSVVIWTTTPWTLPANLAIALHPEYEYSAVRAGGKGYIVATEMLAPVTAKLDWDAPEEIARFKGTALEGRKARHPFIDRESLILTAQYVTLEAGTGCVHTAPGHGYDDYVTGINHKLNIYCPVDGAGRFMKNVEHFAGDRVFEANPKIVELMRSNGALLHSENFEHSYPHCWRCHNPIIFRATPQWFIAMDKGNLRETTLEAIKKVRWIPAWGEERIRNMVKDRPDWCISRQRDWGVPITAFYCKDCGETLLDKKLIDHVAGIFEKEGADAWYLRPPAELMPEGTICPKCGGKNFEQDFDILDVWFDSGSSHIAALGKRDDMPWPADLYLEGGDQYRGWFQSSLLISTALTGQAPYRATLTHGWTLDEKGRAMSKSKGIGFDPNDMVKARGAEIARLLVSSVSYVEDVRIFDELLDRLGEAYRKIRNTCRFILGNLGNQQDAAHPRFNPDTDRVPYDEMLEIDRWAVSRTERLTRECVKGYEDYQFHRVYGALYNFCTVDMSAFYLDILKDRLYTAATHSPARRSAQTALWTILDALIRLLAPVLSFTSEEVYTAMHEGLPAAGKAESVHTLLFPEAPARPEAESLLAEWEKIRLAREPVLKALEEVRKSGAIGNSLEAGVRIRASEENASALLRHKDDLRYIFIVSQAEIAVDAGAKDGLEIEVTKAAGAKCERCWNYSPAVGADAEFPTLCERCAPVVKDLAARFPELKQS